MTTVEPVSPVPNQSRGWPLIGSALAVAIPYSPRCPDWLPQPYGRPSWRRRRPTHRFAACLQSPLQAERLVIVQAPPSIHSDGTLRQPLQAVNCGQIFG